MAITRNKKSVKDYFLKTTFQHNMAAPVIIGNYATFNLTTIHLMLNCFVFS